MTSNAATTIDPVTTEVVASRLRETAATMEYALYHSGYSPILRESKDGTAGLTDPEGRVVIISGGLQYHFTAYQQAVQAVLARYPAADLKPGESFISNDPYKCGSPHDWPTKGRLQCRSICSYRKPRTCTHSPEIRPAANCRRTTARGTRKARSGPISIPRTGFLGPALKRRSN